ncbi:HVA22-like protein a [Cornus florida]|uniref:HVA22-like protein a n=1 Tax=Cornus florida TaxID=4283 RepID=UPI0028A0BD38|nr:HVA22-like protein a [Cornus florida]
MREMGSRNFLDLVAKNIDVIAGPLIALVYPLYASIKAIETKSRADDQQWLTYWVMYSLMTLFELTFANVLEWFPIWPYAKLIATCWLVLPQFNGAAYVYQHFVRPFYRSPPTSRIWYIPGKKNIFREPDDILTAAERYIEKNGTEAFERLISRADREARVRRSDYMIFDDDYRY